MGHIETSIPLVRKQFSQTRSRLFSSAGYELNGFTYSTGVEAVSVKTEKWELTWLPFLGQQIWNYQAAGEQISMKSPVAEPSGGVSFLENYGGFLLHCGLSGMGNPGSGDSHPLHGELHALSYQDACLRWGVDPQTGQEYLELGGSVRYANSYGICYIFRPRIRTWPHLTWFSALCEIENLRRRPMPYAYLAHINFFPSYGDRIYTTAWKETEVRKNPPEESATAPVYNQWYDSVSSSPEQLLRFDKNHIYDPELVMWCRGHQGPPGSSCSMAVRSNGTAFWVSQDAEKLSHGIRWISIDEDFQAAGILLPATAETEGFAAEKKKGHIQCIPPQGTEKLSYRFGLLDDPQLVETLKNSWEDSNALTGMLRQEGLAPEEER